MGVVLALFLVFIGGVIAIIFSVLAWRLKEDVYFYIGLAFTVLILIYILVNFKYILFILMHADSAMFGIITLSFLVIPTIFLVKAKSKSGPLDDQQDVTDAYLDDIINSEDDEIDYN